MDTVTQLEMQWSELALSMKWDIVQSSLCFSQLIDLWSEPHRGYHNTEHLFQSLEKFNYIAGKCENPNLMRIAIWFHDAIYDPKAKNPQNEKESAELAVKWLKVFGSSIDIQNVVYEAIMATADHKNIDIFSISHDTACLLDADLSVLGAESWEEFKKYEDGIRFEYSFVPLIDYKVKRAAVLKNLLNTSSTVYITPEAQALWEENAIRNVNKLIVQFVG
eukprot:TRINITY_DN4832_c0_g1_i1.p1 TRINITY_DN4832_c0_g1~~TRINITY_DN4832_c0_g1_i1.p1  ORF type:complete len:220 (+),score=45.40 TRINITY_DN4832_c0_g1_i1:162-821(+)